MKDGAAETRALTAIEETWIAKAREKADVLYEGAQTPHRSCGIALAETFGLGTRPYQALRRGGITGQGRCGAIVAGQLVLGELLGDPDPTGPVTDALRSALTWYERQVPSRIDRGKSPDYVCNNLTAQHGDFRGPARAAHCNRIVASVASLVAEAFVRFGDDNLFDIPPVDEETA